MFSCVWLHFKIFFEKYFLVFGKEEWRGKPRKTRTNPEEHGAISQSVDRNQRERCFARSRRAISRSFSLSFSLCASSLCVSSVLEIIWSENRNGNEFPWSVLLFYGQLKMIFRKFNFPNHQTAHFTENDFLKPFSPKTNTALNQKIYF